MCWRGLMCMEQSASQTESWDVWLYVQSFVRIEVDVEVREKYKVEVEVVEVEVE